MEKASTLVPYVVEQTAHGERAMDIFSRLLKDRIVFLGSEVNDMVANSLIAQFLFLQSEDPSRDIDFYINSPGGSITAGLAIYDTMQILSCDIRTFCLGQAASMGAVLLAAGASGKRFALPRSRIMLHQPWGGSQGTAADIGIQAQEILRLRSMLNDILVLHTGQSLKRIQTDTDRDFFMSADEAKEYKLIDSVFTAEKNKTQDEKK